MTTHPTEPADAGDRTRTEALRLAKAYHEKMGWKYTPRQIGETAAEILNAMNAATKGPTP